MYRLLFDYSAVASLFLHNIILFRFIGDRTDATTDLESGFPSLIGGLRAPCASTEDLTFRDDDGDNDDTDQENDLDGNEDILDGCVKKLNDDVTPTPSISLCSTPSPNCASLAATPVHKPKQEINLCISEKKKI